MNRVLLLLSAHSHEISKNTLVVQALCVLGKTRKKGITFEFLSSVLFVKQSAFSGNRHYSNSSTGAEITCVTITIWHKFIWCQSAALNVGFASYKSRTKILVDLKFSKMLT